MILSYVNALALASRCPASQGTNTSSFGFVDKWNSAITRLRTGEILRFENTAHNLFSCGVSGRSTYISRLSTSRVAGGLALVSATPLRSTMAPVRQHVFLAHTAENIYLVTSLPPEIRCSSASHLTALLQETVSMSNTAP